MRRVKVVTAGICLLFSSFLKSRFIPLHIDQAVKRIAKSASKKLDWLFALMVLVATFLAYAPALPGTFVWDDDAWTTGIEGKG